MTLLAETDFEALGKAKQSLGANVPFKLWEGTRLALTYKPQAADLSERRETGPTH